MHLMTGEQVRGAVKDGRGYNQIEWIKLLLLQSEYSFCSLSSTNGGLRDSDSSLEKRSAGSGRSLLDQRC